MRDAEYWDDVANKLVGNGTIKGNWYKKRNLVSMLLKEFDFFNKDVLEIGCGYGVMGHYLIQIHARHINYVGTDISQGMADAAKKVFGININVCRANSMPFEDKSFDYVLALDVLEHIPEDEKKESFMEMGRVLRPGGFIAINNPLSISGHESQVEYGFDAHDLASLVDLSHTILFSAKTHNVEEYERSYQFIVLARPGGENGR